MSNFEADIEGSETAVLFPGEGQTVKKKVDIADVNGTDYTVAEVKRQLLAPRGIANPGDYTMIGYDSTNGRESFRDDAKMVDYKDKYLTSSTSYLTFDLKDV
ncbi:unnamed protein product [Lymnaea stagnalis]|uniref:Uncharacterized protein n=1 Tax=Lymnaea stagnalis TaxID=6523 RepID=A0AAV2IBZ8_LYMST